MEHFHAFPHAYKECLRKEWRETWGKNKEIMAKKFYLIFDENSNTDHTQTLSSQLLKLKDNRKVLHVV